MIRFGVIGFGYWGPNLVRNIADCGATQIAGVSDLRKPRLDLAQARYPGILVTPDHRKLIESDQIDAIAISTPVFTHFDLAMEALRAGKHVLVEKPITSTSREAQTLIEEAEKRKLLLMVDHTFIYTGAVRKMRELVETGALGDLYYYDSVRVNLGLFQPDINVIWDLAVHDLAIMSYVMSARPLAVSATGMSHVPGQPENIAYITIYLENNILGHVHVNWLSPVKVRKTLVSGSKKMIVYDDMEISEKIKVYDKGITVEQRTESHYKMLVGYRAGDMWAPNLDTTEAIGAELKHFADCVNNGTRPLSGGAAGLEVVRILEAATESMKQRGAVVELEAAAKA